jgi:beta-glucosidase
VEGATHEDGRGTSIWDTFLRIPEVTRDGDTGDVACDQYHRFEQDIDLMASLGIGAYRFSIAWPRIQPEGHGPVNVRGLDHYRRLVDALNRRGIAPVVTLYHWDLPQALEDRGGWGDRDTASRFADYAAIVHGALGGDVTRWITVNEPWVAAWLGYGSGTHAPGHADLPLALAASHHLLVGHGFAQEAMGDDAGITLNLEPHRPASSDPADVRAARLADLHMNAQYLDPLFGRGYPTELEQHYREICDWGFVRDGDLEVMARPLAFLGVNYYRPQTITGGLRSGALEVPGSLGAWSIVPPGADVTARGWPIDPSGLRELLLRLHRDYPRISLTITENGAAFDDEVGPDGVVDDPRRIAYLDGHIAALGEALEAGVAVDGYFVWSLLDNLEWAEGFGKRFGLVHVDFESQVRTPKRSAWWYRDLIQETRTLPPSLTGPADSV